MRFWLGAALFAAMMAASPSTAETAREVLAQASFSDRDPDDALKRITAAQALATAALKHNPDDREAQLMQATALGYRARRNGSRSDAIAARKLFEAMVARDSRARRRSSRSAHGMSVRYSGWGGSARARSWARRNPSPSPRSTARWRWAGIVHSIQACRRCCGWNSIRRMRGHANLRKRRAGPRRRH